MNKKIRRGNDIEITWSLYDSENDPYIVDGRNFVVELCNEYGKIQPSNVTSEGNRIHFYYRGKDQKYLGSYALKYIENGGQVDMVTFDTKDAFFIVAHSWQAVDAGETPETIQIEVVTIGSALLEKVGPRGYSAYEIAVQEGFVGTVDEWLASLNGDAAGFGEVDAEVDANIGTPEVEVSTSGPDTEKNIHFKFKNIKGEKGDEPVLTAGTDGTIYSDGQVLTEVIKDAKAQAGDDHSRAELDHTQASNDHTQAGSDHSTASGDHVQAGNDHTQAVSDHGVAAADHTQAGLDHNASTEATAKANNVNATIDGTVVTITDKNGVSTSVDIGFDIYKTYASVAAMNADAANVSEGKFVMIATTDQTSTENARLYVRNENAASSESPFTFLCDLDQAATSAWADWFENYKPTIEADHTRAENDHTLASSDHGTAAADHTQAGNDHTRAEGDHSTAADDHTLAGTDHNTAASDHTLAGTDHQTAASDHTLAGTDHQTAASDHTTASNDHTTAGNDHTTAGNDHTRAESDHTRAESDHTVVEGYNTRLTNVEGEVSQLGQYVDNIEFVKVVTDADDKILYGVKTDGDFYFGAGVPSQVQEEIDNLDDTKVDKVTGKQLSTEDYTTAEKTKLGALPTNDGLNNAFDAKVDKEEGKSLIDAEYAASQSVVDNPEYMQFEVDSEDKILGGRKADGTKFENLPVELQGIRYEVIDNPEWIEVKTDKEGKILEGRKPNGNKVENCDVEYPNGIPNDIKGYIDKISSAAQSNVSAESYNQRAVDKCNYPQNFVFNTYSINAGKITLRYPDTDYILKATIFGDLHIGLSYSMTVIWDNWENCVEQGFKWASDKRPYFGLAMGDQLCSMNAAVNNKGVRELNDYYNRIRPFNYPLFSIAGNHDDAVSEFVHNGVIEIANVRIICFCATLGYISFEDPSLSTDPVGNVTDETYAWLEQQVIDSYNNNYITILACHYCLYQTPGHHELHWNGYINDHRDDIIGLCSDYNVRLFISAHNHRWGLDHEIVVDQHGNSLDMTNVQFGMGGWVYSEFIIKNDGFYFTEHRVGVLDHTDETTNYYVLSDDHVTFELYIPMTDQANGTIYTQRI